MKQNKKREKVGLNHYLNPNLNHLVEQTFQGVNKLPVLAFENDTQRTSHSGYYLSNVEIKNYNVMINEETFFDKPIKKK